MKSDKDKGKWKFCIESPKTQFIFYVETELERNQWVNGIRSIAEGKFLKGQLMEKPALVTKDGQVLGEDEAKKLVKKGKIPDGVTTAAPPAVAAQATGFARSAQGTQAAFQRSPHQIEELISPTQSTSALMGKKLKWETEEKARDLFACNLGKERNSTFGGAEVDDGDDWLVETEENTGGCTQQ